MRTNLRAIGSDTGLIIDPALLHAANLEPGAEVEVEARDGTLTVRPIGSAKHNPVEDAFKRVIDHPEDINRVRTADNVSESETGHEPA